MSKHSTTIYIDVWGGKNSMEHVARIKTDALYDMASLNELLNEGYLLNLRKDKPNFAAPFDNRTKYH